MEGTGFLESVKQWPAATKTYFGEIRAEMRRVTWPNRNQVQSTTAVVILAVFAFAAYFAIVDAVLQGTIMKLHANLTK